MDFTTQNKHLDFGALHLVLGLICDPTTWKESRNLRSSETQHGFIRTQTLLIHFIQIVLWWKLGRKFWDFVFFISGILKEYANSVYNQFRSESFRTEGKCSVDMHRRYICGTVWCSVSLKILPGLVNYLSYLAFLFRSISSLYE